MTNDAISTEKPFDGNREAGLSGQAGSPLALTFRNASDDIHPLHLHAAASNSLASVANRLRARDQRCGVAPHDAASSIEPGLTSKSLADRLAPDRKQLERRAS
jgi:hypothetical protein